MNNTLIRIYKYLTLHVTSTQFSILCSNKSKKTLRKENSTLVKVRKKVKVEAGGCLTLGLHTVLYFLFSVVLWFCGGYGWSGEKYQFSSYC